jgi:hypothetical protein
MAQPSGEDHLREGWRALEEARRQAAQAAFEAALADEETPDGLDGLGHALWSLGAVEDGIAAPASAPSRATRTTAPR